VSKRNISAAAWAEIEKAIAQLGIDHRDRQSGSERGQEPAPVHGLRRRERRERHAEGVQRFIVAPHGELAAHLVERGNAEETEHHPGPRPQQK
jgi:hypothetical protein